MPTLILAAMAALIFFLAMATNFPLPLTSPEYVGDICERKKVEKSSINQNWSKLFNLNPHPDNESSVIVHANTYNKKTFCKHFK